MQRRLFLTGGSGVGKSTLIRQLLGDKLSAAGGFISQRQLNEDGSLLGYDILPAAAAAGIEGLEGQRFLDYSVQPPRADNEVFRSFGVQLLKEAQYYPFAMLDEIGGYELLIPQFRNALSELLNSDVPIIGVIKGAANARELRRRFHFGSRFTAYTRQLRSALKADPDTLIIDVRRHGDKKAAEAIKRWMAEYTP